MSSLAELDFGHKYFLDQSTLLFGESKTGKSFIIVDILYQLQPFIDQVLVISPTDRQNHTYDSGLVPQPLIHYTFTPELLKDIWERQEAFAKVYTQANDPVTLRRLFDMCSDNSRARSIIETINRKLVSYREEIEDGDDDDATARTKIAEMDTECKKLITLIFKQCINEHRGKLQKMTLSKAEQHTLKYLNINPRMVLIFDDCTDLLTRHKNNQTLQKIFYQGRHVFITIMIALHTDKALPPELKKNAFTTIFTEQTCARSYFERPSNDLDKEARQRARDASRAAFEGGGKYQKLAWIRDEKKFYRFTATSRPKFRFGSHHLWDFCQKIQSESGGSLSNNKFIHDFC